jgi:hypothetical protein
MVAFEVRAPMSLDYWTDQDAAQFGRRAHGHFGRGFVLGDPRDRRSPVYVTRLAGAPPALWQEVHLYQPDRESILVTEEDGGLNVRRIRIDLQQ